MEICERIHLLLQTDAWAGVEPQEYEWNFRYEPRNALVKEAVRNGIADPEQWLHDGDSLRLKPPWCYQYTFL